jgi:folylpolyglutamate synthase/dihydropteroate synthase
MRLAVKTSICCGNQCALSAGGKPISLERLDKLIDTNRTLLQQALEADPGISYFEALTALAVRHFADADVDWAIMEAGLGGVADATNVFKAHQVS